MYTKTKQFIVFGHLKVEWFLLTEIMLSEVLIENIIRVNLIFLKKPMKYFS